MINWSLTEFSIDPIQCLDTIVYKCAVVTGPDGASYKDRFCPNDPDLRNGLSWLADIVFDYKNGGLPEGTYQFVITGTNLAGQTLPQFFTWTLRNPCNPPDSITMSDITIPDYVINNAE